MSLTPKEWNILLALEGICVYLLFQQERLEIYIVFMQLQGLESTLMELWNIMDTPSDERNKFDHITRFISVSPDAFFFIMDALDLLLLMK
jgi:hypothetical protein